LRLRPRKSSKGYISYDLNIGPSIAKRCGLIGADGERLELEITEKPNEKEIIVKAIKKE
jgi:hypothetical protein